MNFLSNFDLLSVGAAVTISGIFGFVVFLNNRRSVTNRTFLFFSLSFSVYSIFNYVSYQVESPRAALWLIRLVIFSAVWYSFSLFQLFYVFPNVRVRFSRAYTRILVPFTAFVSLLTLTPLVFQDLMEAPQVGQVAKVIPGPLVFLFGLLASFFVFGGLYLLGKKFLTSRGEEHVAFRFLLTGFLLSFPLYLVFNFILPVGFGNVSLIPLASILIFPFILYTTYAIVRHHILPIRVIAAEILTALVLLFSFVEIAFSTEIQERIFRAVIFVLLFIFGILLIRSVRKEVEQREELQRLAKKLSDFISFATHELRGPISAFKGAVSMILDGDFGKVPREVKGMLTKIYLEAEEMGQTVETFLNMNKIEIGKFNLMAEEHDFLAIIESAVEQAKYHAREKGVDLKFVKPKGEFPPVYCDRFKIKHVVSNLLSNAIKYNEEKGKVRVSVSQEGKSILVQVSDTGIGIPPDVLPKLFQQYQRGASEARRFAEGSGIGLWLTKKIIDLHGGRIWVESDGKGKGSTFSFTIPIHAVQRENGK